MGSSETNASESSVVVSQSADQFDPQPRIAIRFKVFSQAPSLRLRWLRFSPCAHESSQAGPSSLEESGHGSTRSAPAPHRGPPPRSSKYDIQRRQSRAALRPSSRRRSQLPPNPSAYYVPARRR